ncbi:Mss4-like protein [Phyllosticta capitalensis]|uniref:Mss4-like protein n=2 Tax=Phyllosticta capitalensis TaxID=121624 RepID=A0ABR1YXW2_9PEZI
MTTSASIAAAIMTTYHGKCTCGQTQWDVKLEPDQAKHILCHCNTCKSLSGGTYTLNQIIPRSALTFTSGESALKKYTYTGESGNAVHCYYCANCTTHPFHHQTVMGDDKIVVRTGLLEGGEKFEPAAEIFGKVRWAWEREVAETFETLPPS